ALEIDKPTGKKDYDNIRWYLLHRNVSVFIDNSGGWYVKFESPCEHVQSDNRCGYYENRPKICRDYPAEDEYCEYEGEEDYYTEMFNTEADFTEYLDRKGKKWRYKRL
ncbi:MAG: YkgJ family cysteine cluster protein, partial [Spirochaetota bacterium]